MTEWLPFEERKLFGVVGDRLSECERLIYNNMNKVRWSCQNIVLANCQINKGDCMLRYFIKLLALTMFSSADVLIFQITDLRYTDYQQQSTKIGNLEQHIEEKNKEIQS